MKERGTSTEERVTGLDRRGFLQAAVGASVVSTVGLGSAGTATASGDSSSETIPSGEATISADNEGGSDDLSGDGSVTDNEDVGLVTTGRLLAVGGGGMTALLGYALVRSIVRSSPDDLHRVHVRVIEKETGNPFDEPATLNCSSHDGDHTKTRELPSGTALLRLREGMWTFRVEYSGGIHEEQVHVSAATQTLDIAIEPAD